MLIISIFNDKFPCLNPQVYRATVEPILHFRDMYDLWFEILLRLPVESLLRVKLVSKTWFSIISSHHFAKSHLETAPKDDDIVIVHHDDGDVDDGTFSLFHLDSVRILENLKVPYSHGEYRFDEITSALIGSDCGIVCVCIHSLNWRTDIKKFYDIYLWNLATRHSKPLPPCINIPDNEKIRDTLGFGFDQIDLDFKVVRVVSRSVSGAVSTFAEVYSSNRNGWRKIESKPVNTYHYRNSFDVCFHGFLFVIGRNNCMSAFNLNKEFLIWDINLPAGTFDDATRSIETHVTVLKDTIAVTISDMDEGRIQLWTLDDEACLCDGGVSALWTKVLTVDEGVALYHVEHLFNNAQFSLIDEDGYHYLYDFNKEVTKKIPDSLYLAPYEIFKYTKSLFSLEGFEQIKWAGR